jgi:hypothetical protein
VTTLGSLVVGALGRRAVRRVEAAAADPEAAQLRVLREIVEKNLDTQYGLEHGFSEVRDFAQWRTRVPVAKYEDLKPYVERMAAGETGVLTAEPVEMFARTSGTTAEPKFIPVTKSCRRRAHADSSRAFLWYARRDHPRILEGRSMSLVSPAEEGRTPGGIPFGSTSGAMYRSFPLPVRNTYAVPYDVFEIDDYDTEYYVLQRVGVASDVTFLVTANPTSILRLCGTADERAEEILRDIHDGGLSADLDVPDAVREAVKSRCPADPDRAKELSEARRRRDGRLLPCDYWPNLALISCWKGGSVGFHVDRLQEWFQADGGEEVPVRDLGWLASELRGTIPVADEGLAGVPTIGTNLLEFVDAEEMDGEAEDADPSRRRFLLAHELEEGREYYVFVTTTGGLYRYDMNDVLRPEGMFEKTPRLVFVRKGKDTASLTGEKLTSDQVVAACEGAAQEAGVPLVSFAAEADVGASRYAFKVELGKSASGGSRRKLLEGIERRLREQNIEYKGKRESGRLRPPELHVMPGGWHEGARRKASEEGKPVFQHKGLVLTTREPAQKEGEAPEEVVALE